MSSRKVRFVIFLIAAGIFVIGAPMIVLYSAGYRYNFDAGKIQRTGSLYIETLPTKVIAELNGQIVSQENPVRIDTLLPARYKLKLALEGYHVWEKEIEIKRNLTTFIKGVHLFKSSLPAQVIVGQIDWVKKINDEDRILFTKTTNLGVTEFVHYNLQTEQGQVVYATSAGEAIIDIITAPNVKRVAININTGVGRKVVIINTDNLNSFELASGKNNKWEIARFNNADANMLFTFSAGVLNQINLNGDSITKIMSANILDFAVDGEQIYYVTKIGATPYVVKTTLQKPTADNLIRLPLPASYSFNGSPSAYLLLKNDTSGDFFLLRPDIFSQDDVGAGIIFDGQAKNFAWPNTNTLTYFSDFEISQYNISSSQNQLINRYGEILTGTAAFSEPKYTFYVLNNRRLKVIDKDTSGGIIDLDLAEFDYIAEPFFNNTEVAIYFIGKVGNQQGLYQLKIQ
ncbi:MAG: hypothetical protein COT81_00780 [Candidatus Buchananbacteria bacterium CG10_big_fil_rev_8_21_14_0_10_42_9]|uniref:PEGA domain-containing protein n=1 Tax=Candidatus Buchananbacteria bacterium CG10_big_fil_rev_8_21_14_0_10_42_9 TaxID=1974526 RepID=A0A2H0W2G5_9BACT|nr:MAG: hypothetical protein COT81_00780 [Candidatus Buchananbacteria bacterium CG10_big_fil_rev_8_21_14_0_10_42_9]